VCAVVVAIDRFSAFGATAQPAHSSVKSATTVSLNVLGFVFFMLGLRGVLTPQVLYFRAKNRILLECGFGSEIVKNCAVFLMRNTT
jgi:hypothetical protein